MSKENFIIRDQLFLMIKNLDENSAGQLVKAIAAYLSGEQYDIGNPFIQAAFNTFLPQIQADSDRYEKTVQERSKASKKRWDKETSAPSSDANAMQMDANASVCIPNGIQMDSNRNRNININNNSISTTTVSNKSNILTTTTTSSAVQMVVEEYNKTSFPKVQKLSEERRKAIKARLKTFSPEEILKALKMADASPFLHGDGDKNWVADFDWIMGVKSGGDQHLTRILEGHYSRDKSETARSGTTSTSANKFINFQQRKTDYDSIVADKTAKRLQIPYNDTPE